MASRTIREPLRVWVAGDKTENVPQETFTEPSPTEICDMKYGEVENKMLSNATCISSFNQDENDIENQCKLWTCPLRAFYQNEGIVNNNRRTIVNRFNNNIIHFCWYERLMTTKENVKCH